MSVKLYCTPNLPTKPFSWINQTFSGIRQRPTTPDHSKTITRKISASHLSSKKANWRRNVFVKIISHTAVAIFYFLKTLLNPIQKMPIATTKICNLKILLALFLITSTAQTAPPEFLLHPMEESSQGPFVVDIPGATPTSFFGWTNSTNTDLDLSGNTYNQTIQTPFAINTNAGNQLYAQSAKLDTGYLVHVLETDGVIYAEITDTKGLRIGNVIEVSNNYEVGRNPVVSAITNGFAVAWENDPIVGANYINARVFSNVGVANDLPFKVEDQSNPQSNPTLVRTSDGFICCFTNTATNSDTVPFCGRFNNDGLSLSVDAVQISYLQSGDDPLIISIDQNQYLITTIRFGFVYGVVVDQLFNQQTLATVLHGDFFNVQDHATCSLSNGVAMAWTSGQNIYFQRMDFDLNLVGSITQVNINTPNARDVSISASANDEITIAYTSGNDSYAQVYDSANIPLGAPNITATTTSSETKVQSAQSKSASKTVKTSYSDPSSFRTVKTTLSKTSETPPRTTKTSSKSELSIITDSVTSNQIIESSSATDKSTLDSRTVMNLTFTNPSVISNIITLNGQTIGSFVIDEAAGTIQLLWDNGYHPSPGDIIEVPGASDLLTYQAWDNLIISGESECLLAETDIQGENYVIVYEAASSCNQASAIAQATLLTMSIVN